MDRLPPELLSMILSEIAFGERLRLRLVSKFWRNVIDGQKVNHRLVLIGLDRGAFNELWFHTNVRNSLDDPGLVNVCDLTKLPEKLLRSTLSNLRLLFIDLSATRFEHVVENFLHQLKQLEELNLFGHGLTVQESTLDLPRLRILSVSCDWDKATTIKLQTPCMAAFKCSSLSDYEFAFPDRLTHLAEYSVELGSIMQFVNLECLYCFKIKKYKPVLDRLPKLKEIHTMDREISTLHTLDEEKVRLERTGLRLYSRGIELEDYKTNEIDLDLDEFQAAYYLLTNTGDLPFYRQDFKFGRLANLWLKNYGEDPADFFDKFMNIKSVRVLYLIDEHSFLQFIGNFRNLNEISFPHANSEELKSQLAELQPTITRLEFADTPSLGCLLKFKYLVSLKLVKKLDLTETISFIERLFEQLRYLKMVLLEFGKGMYWTLSVSGHRFSVELRDDRGFASETFDSLERAFSFLGQKSSKPTSFGNGAFADKCLLS